MLELLARGQRRPEARPACGAGASSMAGDRPKRERKMSVQAEESAANAKAATALAAAAREDREAKAKAAKAAKSKPAAAAKKATKTKKRTVEKKSAAPKKKKAASPAKKPATKKTKTKKTDKTCPLLSVSWNVNCIDEEEDTDESEEYKSNGNPISKETLEFKASAGARWFTLREDVGSVNFGPLFEMKEGAGYPYDITEDGSFQYEAAMKIIEDHESKGEDGPPMIYWSSVGGYSAAFELRKVDVDDEDDDHGALQFRFVDAEVAVRSPEEYAELRMIGSGGCDY